MSKIIVNKLRKDGKVNVTYIYEGGENAFGGHYPSKVFNKIHLPEVVQDRLDANHSIDFTNYTHINFIEGRNNEK